MNSHLFIHPNGQKMPNAYRWFVGQGLMSFTPWHFEKTLSLEDSIAKQFERELSGDKKVVTIMRRQDCDDFVGLELIDEKITNRVIYFHPSFGSHKNPGLIMGEFNDLFAFVNQIVLKDFKAWADIDDFDAWKDRFE